MVFTFYRGSEQTVKFEVTSTYFEKSYQKVNIITKLKFFISLILTKVTQMCE